MFGTPPAFRPAPRPTKRGAKRRIFLGLRALLAFLVALLQLTSALHFTLVPHTFSLALGGVVHEHGDAGTSAQRSAPTLHGHAQTLVAGASSCALDRCPFADAPHGSPPFLASTVSGVARFGAPALLAAAEARSPSARRVFLSAPQTSPPIC
jgi:hypothetical protein